MEKVKIVFEDENYLVLLKEAGIDVVGIEKWLGDKGRNDGLARRGIVHRLDKGTSGLLLVARNGEYLEYLKSLFKKRLITKKYWALVSGEVTRDGEVEMPIARSQRHFASFSVNDGGKMARTLFKRLQVFEYWGRKYSLVEIDLKTGRTHQIRVHFKYLGWPLLGDKLYGGDMSLGIDRPCLHAVYLSFVDKNGKEKQYGSEVSRDFEDLLIKFGYEKGKKK